MATKKPRRTSTLGTIYQNKAGSWLVRYERAGQRHTGGHKFGTFELADQWLRAEQTLIDRDEWTPPAIRQTAAQQTDDRDSITLIDFANSWIEHRTTKTGGPLASKTIREYRAALRGRLANLAAMPITDIDRVTIEAWWQDNGDKPPARQSAYMFLKSVLKDAASRELIDSNPCQIVNGSRRVRVTPKQIRSQLIVGLEPCDIEALVSALDRECFRAMVLLVAYCGLRPGEAFALTREDIKQATSTNGLPRWTIHIHKAVSTGEDGNGRALGDTKTGDSIRTVPVPPHLVPAIDDHLSRFAQVGSKGLVFPSTNPMMDYASDRQVMGTYASKRTGKGCKKGVTRSATGFAAARQVIGRPTLRIYDLRHWARRMWTLAGLDYASTEMLLGHELPMVQGTYAHLDLGHVWPYAIKVSELAGWTRPRRTDSQANDFAINPRLMAAMTPEQLTAMFAKMSDAQLAQVVPLLTPEAIATMISAGAAAVVSTDTEDGDSLPRSQDDLP